MIAAKQAIVLWNDEGGKITELKVVDIRDQDSWTGRLDNSFGACNHDWLDGDALNTPMGLWLFLMTKWGFQSAELMLTALREFGQISGEGWVETLLRRLGADSEEIEE